MMTKAEILAELPQLSQADLAEVSAKVDELRGSGWIDNGELSDEEKAELDASLARLKDGSATSEPWPVVKARIIANLK